MSNSWVPLLFVLGVSAVARSATIVVDLQGKGDFPSIQPAIDAALEGDTILVEPGEYRVFESLNFNGKDLTLRSTGGAEKTTIRMALQPSDPNRGSVFIFRRGESRRSVLEGLTIRGGSGFRFSSNDAGTFGGGIFTDEGASPTIRHCIITKNEGLSGGGVHFRNGEPTMEDCLISENGGGGISLFGADANFVDCRIVDNTRTFLNSNGIFCEDSAPTFTDCVISGNTVGTRGDGGGVFCSGGSVMTFRRSRILGNSGLRGGGLHCVAASTIDLLNCEISGNFAFEGSAMGAELGGTIQAVNCTVAGNVTLNVDSTVIWCNEARIDIASSIVWDNTGLPGLRAVSRDCGITVNYSCLQGETVHPGNSNINQDPLFVESGHSVPCVPRNPPNGCVPAEWPISTRSDFRQWISGDYRLLPGSPALDGGQVDVVPEADIEGNERPCGRWIDMGAHELCNDLSRFIRMDTTGDGTVNLADFAFYAQVYLFGPATTIDCPDALDADDDGQHSIADLVFLLGYIFRPVAERPSPKAPFPDCGPDPTSDDLDRFASNNTDPTAEPNDRRPELGSCRYPAGICSD